SRIGPPAPAIVHLPVGEVSLDNVSFLHRAPCSLVQERRIEQAHTPTRNRQLTSDTELIQQSGPLSNLSRCTAGHCTVEASSKSTVRKAASEVGRRYYSG